MNRVVALDALEVHAGARRLLGPLSLHLDAGECVALVGESGSGKSLTVQALLGLLPAGLHARGHVTHGDTRVVPGDAAHAALRGRVLGWVPQDPLASLHPLRRVGAQLLETLRHARGLDARAARNEAASLLARVHLPDPDAALQRFPHEFSGGQRQRIAIALALSTSPRVLVADEPTSALDARIARGILDLLDGLRRETGLALLLVSHDLPLVGAYAQRVHVLRRGEVVEAGATDAVFAHPAHAYTRELLDAERLPPCAAPSGSAAPLLTARGLQLRYPRAAQPALAGVDLDLHRGEGLAIVGESGSGKTSLGRVLLRLARGARGAVHFHPRQGPGVDLLALDAAALRTLRPRMGVVFQDPYASLDPRLRVVDIVGEPLRLQGIDAASRRTRADALLRDVGLDADALDRYPHQFSGGQRQRIAIARALATDPDLLLCDEAVSALDAHHRANILALLARLKAERGLALLFITHDLAAAASVAERILVLEGGRVVETGLMRGVLAAPAHAHTRALLAARPPARA